MTVAFILFIYLFAWCDNTIVGSHSLMTHASMDIGNIISIVIPENSPTNINIEQLTLDFRRQLERIKYQSQILNKNTSDDRKTVFSRSSKLSDIFMGHKEKSDTHIDDTHRDQYNYYLSQNNKLTNYIRSLKNKSRVQNSRRYYSPSLGRNRKNIRTTNIKGNKDNKRNSIRKKNWQMKINNHRNAKNTKSPFKRRNYISHRNQAELSSCMVVNHLNKVQTIQNYKVHANKPENNSMNNNDNNDINNNNCVEEVDRHGQKIFSCYNGTIINSIEAITGNETNFYNNEDINNKNNYINNNDNNGDIESNLIINNTTLNNISDDRKKIFPINIAVADFNAIEKLMKNPEEILDHLNISTVYENDLKINANSALNTPISPEIHDNNNSNKNNINNNNLHNAALLTSINRRDTQLSVADDSKGLINDYVFVDKNQHDFINNEEHEQQQPLVVATDQPLILQNGMQSIPTITSSNINDNEDIKIDHDNFEIRIRRSVNDNVMLKKKLRKVTKVKWVAMKESEKSKNSGKLYPNIEQKN